MKAVIIDDEYYAIEGLKHELYQFQEIDIVRMYNNGEDFIKDYMNVKPDLVFLDIEMPILNGFDVLVRLSEVQSGEFPKIVFVTAYQEYAIQAFEVNALDYIVKPVTHERLEKTIQRILPEFEKEKPKAFGENLQIHTFGHFGIYSEGIEIPLEWRSKKAEELFIYLLMQKGHFVSKEKIVGDLWPELNSERGLSNLYLCYYYIKQTFKNAGILIGIESKRGKMRIQMRNLSCDFMIFNELVDRINFSCGESKLQSIEELCKIYEGPLLDGYYLEWNEFNRQFYEVQVIEYCRELCDRLSLQKSDKLAYYEVYLKKYMK